MGRVVAIAWEMKRKRERESIAIVMVYQLVDTNWFVVGRYGSSILETLHV